MKHFFIFALSLIFYFSGQAQVDPVRWKFNMNNTNKSEIELIMSAEIDNDWALYSQHLGESGPFPTTFTVFNNYGEEIQIVFDEPQGIEVYDELFEMNIIKFKKQVVFSKTFKRSDFGKDIQGTVTYMTCDDTKCLPPNSQVFQFDLPK